MSRVSVPAVTAVTSKVSRRATLGPRLSVAGSRQSVLPDSDHPEIAPSPPPALRRRSESITIQAQGPAWRVFLLEPAARRRVKRLYHIGDEGWRREVARAGHAENGNPPEGCGEDAIVPGGWPEDQQIWGRAPPIVSPAASALYSPQGIQRRQDTIIAGKDGRQRGTSMHLSHAR